ncbi:MAG: inositol monophosphatase family protein [Alphaproteobacteria bacterium]
MAAVRQSALINVMIAAAKKAGRGLVRDFGEVEQLQVSRKGPGDFVSQADLKAERTLRRELQKARETYGLLMEESGETPGSDTSNRWVVDPLDGTSNFLHGVPHFAVSVALERDRQIQAGVVYNPVTDELYWAEKGIGAYLNDRRLRVSARTEIGDAMVMTGIPHGLAERAERYLPMLGRVAPKVGAVRRFGAAALDLAWVASGRADAFFEFNLSRWDIAAGLLIVREAGGFVSDIDGRDRMMESGDIVASNATLHEPLLALLRSPSGP